MFVVALYVHLLNQQVHSYVKTCVATGGGIVSEKKNWGKLQTGMVVWLDMEVRTLLRSVHTRGMVEERRFQGCCGCPGAFLVALLKYWRKKRNERMSTSRRIEVSVVGGNEEQLLDG